MANSPAIAPHATASTSEASLPDVVDGSDNADRGNGVGAGAGGGGGTGAGWKEGMAGTGAGLDGLIATGGRAGRITPRGFNGFGEATRGGTAGTMIEGRLRK